MSGAGQHVSQGVYLNPEHFRAAFPFHIALGPDLEIKQIGSTLISICPDLHPESSAVERFELIRPIGTFSIEHIRKNLGSFFLLKHRVTKLLLRGGFSRPDEGETLLFLGSPWFTDASQLKEFDLSFDDFALHDPVVDMLQVFQASKLALDDGKQLANKLRAQREEARQAFATLDACEDAALIIDPESLRFLYANQGAVRYLGYAREELLRMTPLNLEPDFTEAQLREKFSPMTRGAIPSLTVTTEYRRKNGTALPVEINYRYVAPPGENARFIAIARDIVERRKSEQRLLHSQRLESIGTLAAGVAHNLNNSLAPVIMASELLAEEYPDHTETIDTVLTCAKRAAEMVRQLMLFAKGTVGERVRLMPQMLVKEIEKIITSTFSKNIFVAVKCATSLPPIMADTTQLHQVLLNLCVNARDAMPSGGLLTLEVDTVEISSLFATTIAEAKPGHYLVMRVSDTGVGIAPEIMDRIFDPYFTTKPSHQGTGLGLSTVAGIVRGHGGFVQASSTPEIGSTFSVYLPIEKPTDMVVSPPDAVGEFRGNGETILLVDDEFAILSVGQVVLTRLNFTPLIAASGGKGVLMAIENQHTIKAAVVDFHMPHMDGLACTRAIRQLLPNLPVAVASGALDPSIKKVFESMGVSTFLEKPFTQMALIKTMTTLLAPT